MSLKSIEKFEEKTEKSNIFPIIFLTKLLYLYNLLFLLTSIKCTNIGTDEQKHSLHPPHFKGTIKL